MSGSEHARPVWLTAEQADACEKMATEALLSDHWAAPHLDAIAAAWDAAPADPAEAVYRIFREQTPLAQSMCDLAAEDVLRALGNPTIEGGAS